MSDMTVRPPLAELLEDQRRRWQAGAALPVEEYLADHPALAGDSAAVLDLIFQEVVLRERRGETPRPEEYARRFPHLADTLRLQFLVDRALWSETPPTGDSARDVPATKVDAATAPEPSVEAPPRLGGYELLGLLGRGGMGVVWLGRDRRLGRDVAVKVMKAELAGQPRLVHRFLEEAQVASQLQHPAIPPIHELGELADGRPYFVMKVVRGRTLADLLAARRGPADDRPRLVAIFEQVCQALAYAHSKGVLHRDLKPSNVMVGAFGEVQVMDWGLAKVLTDEAPGAAAGSVVETVRTADTGHQTQAGSVLGTYAYMAPEQARGEVERLDRRCDVFGLGALLCEILTGQPPYAGAFEEARAQARLGQVAPARQRLAACGADAELVEVAGRCLSAAAEERPGDAAEVTAALTAYLARVQERLQRAELERAAAQARAVAERERRRVQLALCAALGVLLLGGGAVAWWSAAQAQAARARQGRNAEAVAGLLDKCEQALRGGDAARAAVTLEAARKRAAEGGADEAVARLEALAADLALLRDLDAIDQFRCASVYSVFPCVAAVAARYREALGRSRADPDAVSPEAAASRASGSAVRDRITAAWDWLLGSEKTAGVRAALRAVDADSFRDEVRDAVRADDRDKITALAGRPVALEQPPEFAAFLGASGAIGVGRRRQLLEAAVGRHPGDLGLLMALAETYPWNQHEGSEQRLRWYQAAVAAAPTNPAAHNGLGAVLYDRRDLVGAEAAFREALRLEPKDAWVHNNLGNVLLDRQDLAGAEAAFREALRLKPKHANARNGLGSVLWARGDLAGAEEAYREALQLEPKLALAHNNLGLALEHKGDVEGAIAKYKEALLLEPKLALAHNNLGLSLQGKGDLERAVAEFKEALRLDPNYPSALFNLPRAERMRSLLSRLPAVLAGQAEPEAPAETCALALVCAQPFQKRYAAAVRLFDHAFTADPKLAADHKAAHRYNAACSAVRAAAGEGIDAPTAAADRTALRQKALGWLRADLAHHQKQASAADVAERRSAAAMLAHWLADTDLAGVREPQPLATLPAAERAAWEQLWAGVKTTLAAARKPAPPPAKE